ncbi:hypothetical protein [Nocardioides montaniterrae]
MTTRNRRRSGTLILLLAALVGLLVPRASAGTDPMPTYTWTGTPSPLYVLRNGADLPLSAYSWCWTGPSVNGSPSPASCADGVVPPVREQPKTWSHGDRRLWFGRPGWTFRARAQNMHSCLVVNERLRAERVAPRRFVLHAPAEPGDYRVRIFGTGPEGDVSIAFVWHYRTTTRLAGGCGPVD